MTFEPLIKEYKSTFVYEFICIKCGDSGTTSYEHGSLNTIKSIIDGKPMHLLCREKLIPDTTIRVDKHGIETRVKNKDLYGEEEIPHVEMEKTEDIL